MSDLSPWETPPARDGQGWLVDTHAHLADSAFDADRDEVLARAAEGGVRLVVAVGADLDSSRRTLDLARSRAEMPAAVGIHPHDAGEATADGLATLREMASDPRVVAIGEIGLDYYRMRAPREAQLRALEAQLAIADEVGKPVVIHNREADADVLAVLVPWAQARRQAGRPGAPGVLHCYSGGLALAEAASAAGLLISFAGNVTFAKAEELAEVARRIDLGVVVLETDSPYLAPAPLRGRRHEPANVLLVAQWLADQRGRTLREVADQTSANARRLFGLG